MAKSQEYLLISKKEIKKEMETWKSFCFELVKQFSKNFTSKISDMKRYQQVSTEELKICKEKVRVLS